MAASYLANWLLGLTSLPDLVQAPILAALPGPLFGFLVDSLQHTGKVAEETGVVAAFVAIGAVAGAGLAIALRLEAATDLSRRRILQLTPPLIGGAALAVVGARLLPEWYLAVRPPEGGAGEVPPITPTSSFYVVSKNFRDPVVVLDSWTLHVHGLVDRELHLGYADLASMPQAAEIVTLECISNPVGGRLMSTGQFEGPRLIDIVSRAHPQPDARYLSFQARDGYVEGIPHEELRPEMLVALTLDGTPLPNEHGYPARILIPGRYGMKGPKWLQAIELVASASDGYWETRGWNADAVVKTTSRIDVPADGVTVGGPVIRVAGVAFAGSRGISRVEWTDDGGTLWRRANLDQVRSEFSWRTWSASWRPQGPGDHTLTVRATDGLGAIQSEQATSSFPGGAAGLHSVRATVIA